jgi:hypothetical protein
MDDVPLDIARQEPDPTTLQLRSRGPWPLPPSPRVTIVGARRPTTHREAVVERLAQELTERGVLVIGGLSARPHDRRGRLRPQQDRHGRAGQRLLAAQRRLPQSAPRRGSPGPEHRRHPLRAAREPPHARLSHPRGRPGPTAQRGVPAERRPQPAARGPSRPAPVPRRRRPPPAEVYHYWDGVVAAYSHMQHELDAREGRS